LVEGSEIVVFMLRFNREQVFWNRRRGGNRTIPTLAHEEEGNRVPGLKHWGLVPILSWVKPLVYP